MPSPYAPSTPRRVSLASVDPDLLAGIPERHMQRVARLLTVPHLRLARGEWRPVRDTAGADGTPLLVTAGLLARDVRIADRVATQLLGPGDVVDPWIAAREGRPSQTVHWTVHEPIRAAVLDERFSRAACRWPCLSAAVLDRVSAMADRLAAQLAICQLASVDQRVVAVLWHLADRFGRVTPDGVVVGVRLSHRLLGQLAGARRPTVTLSIGKLMESGVLSRRDDGLWVLPAETATDQAA